MGYNFNLDLSSENFDIGIDTSECYGYFEHVRLGEARGGGLWFQECHATNPPRLELTDYDGVFELPTEVISALLLAHIIVGEEFL